jgi:hypothetical protein
VQVLPWDFSATFPHPTEEAVEAGVINEDDCEPEAIKSIHEEHAREALANLRALDELLDARRRGVDPKTGKPPRTHATKERLRRYFAEQPGRLEHAFQILMDVYANAFGDEAADAFTKAIRAWHAGIEVTIEKTQVLPAAPIAETATKPRRLSSRMPVPKPLHHAVKSGRFGQDEHGKPIKPSADEVREITETHAEKLIEANEHELREGIKKYAEDFGERPAAQLEAYVRRQQNSR